MEFGQRLSSTTEQGQAMEREHTRRQLLTYIMMTIRQFPERSYQYTKEAQSDAVRQLITLRYWFPKQIFCSNERLANKPVSLNLTPRTFSLKAEDGRDFHGRWTNRVAQDCLNAGRPIRGAIRLSTGRNRSKSRFTSIDLVLPNTKPTLHLLASQHKLLSLVIPQAASFKIHQRTSLVSLRTLKSRQKKMSLDPEPRDRNLEVRVTTDFTSLKLKCARKSNYYLILLQSKYQSMSRLPIKHQPSA